MKAFQDVPDPRPGKGEVLVDIYAAGLNFFDILMAQGQYQTKPPLPFVLGVEFTGRISAASPVPAGCPFRPGDRVSGMGQGAYASHVAVDWRALMPLPPGVGFAAGVGACLTLPTAYEGLVGRAKLAKGEWVLVHAAAGGVGTAACQVAKLFGARVIAAAGSEAKRRVCVERAGADAAVDYRQDGWQKEVVRLTGGRGVDVVFDPVGMLVPSLKCAAPGARLVVVGFAGGEIEKVPANLLLLKNVAVVGWFWGGLAAKNPRRAKEVLEAVHELLASGKLRPLVYDRLYEGVDEVGAGLRDIEAREVWGKAVVRLRAEQAKL
ncbi:hypothetical protein Q5752_003461 [Cryptotrichosporon argae]